ncbi:MAG: alanine--tRNA ligase [Candidatus Aenigmarchaeota archaeon]|nr:alanine--tRNA ligase [Candidatus Aenigmarchaeota archaeon]
MDRTELIKKYISFFTENGHKEIANASLIPENDPTVLFTTAGMHPLVPVLLGARHPLGKRLCNVQRCIRTQDIDGVGDAVHHTFFEMLGNWSLGDYFKEEAIRLSFEFLTKALKVPVERLAISCFAGDRDAPKDRESADVWKSLGIPEERIAFLGKEDNWWGPAGKTGPCGPDTEMFYWSGEGSPPKKFDPKDSRWVEIWNDVLMQYVKDEKGNYCEAAQKNVDTGMGVERTAAVLSGLDDDYLSSCFLPIIRELERLSGKKYAGHEKEMRIIADHVKAAVFIIADGVTPSNVERGYVLRRLIRRAIRYGRLLGMRNFVPRAALPVFDIYSDYRFLEKNKAVVLRELDEEEKRFAKTLEGGMREFERVAKNQKRISGRDAFLLYQSYGFPIEMTLELAKEKGVKVDERGFDEENMKHQELSRTASAGVFKSGLADSSEETKRLHTATHLLNAAIKDVLRDKSIHQRGSNITPERLRFDFSFGRKLTQEEIRKVEDLVNEKIREGLPVTAAEMSPDEALRSGAEGVFGHKYGEAVSVYSIGTKGREFSREICAGPHVKNTKELGRFKIVKEEASAAGVRRIKAVLERDVHMV